ncbi:MAG: xanthine dehydrogenase family protein molybdopterin-binding subunit [Burkholderiaceae bacterium]|nr:xanthine dehydrogenase family protein molybdopterin-binding subunit [Burkholderiaceae bacterium]
MVASPRPCYKQCCCPTQEHMMNFDSLRFGEGKAGDQDDQRAFVTGQGRYTHDMALAGQLYAVFVRSVQAHARIKSINTQTARSMPGVHGIFTGQDLEAAGIGRIPPIAAFNGRDGQPMFKASIPVLATGKVRYVGEAVAVVVADSAREAMDAAEAVDVELESLPAIINPNQAMEPNAVRLHEDHSSNIVLDWEDGAADVSEAAFKNAHHIESVTLEDPPMAACAIEPRAAIGQWDAASQRFTLMASTQGVMVVRKLLAEGVFKVAPESIRVLTPDVGGGFGAKVQAYSEYAAILFASKQLNRPVKWTATRIESFLADTHGRNSTLKAEMAFDREGKILGLRTDVVVGIGAYTSTYVAIVATNNTKNCLSSVYKIPSIRIRSRLVLTNAMPLGPYRGAGRPEAIYMIEQLLDRAATRMGMDRIALRRRNMIPPSAMPYTAPNGQVYDSGEFEAVMDKALALAKWNEFDQRRRQSESNGRLRGIGICCFLEVAGGILEEPADLRFHEDGTVSLHTGAQAIGQGHLTTFPKLIADQLGIDVGRVRLVAGDSDQVPGLVPTVASRSMMMGGSATRLACDEAIERGKRISAHLLEAGVQDIEFSKGEFRIKGTDRSIHILDLTKRARAAGSLPTELPQELSNVAKFTSPAMSFPNGCHVSEVELDPQTGAVEVVQHTAVDDVGVILNEDIVNGQIIGGVAQGLGQVLGEELRYDNEGQLLNASFMDYPMPRADTMPPIVIGHHVVPCTTNPIGVKGAGESGVAGAMPAATAAVLDALASRGAGPMDLPFTSERVWRALNQ